MLFHLLTGQEDTMNDMAVFIYEQDPMHPLGLWFTGLWMMNDPAQSSAGLYRMKQALEHDLERYMPVDENLKQMVLGDIS